MFVSPHIDLDPTKHVSFAEDQTEGNKPLKPMMNWSLAEHHQEVGRRSTDYIFTAVIISNEYESKY